MSCFIVLMVFRSTLSGFAPHFSLARSISPHFSAMLAANPRTVMQVKNLARLDGDERARIARRADEIRSGALDA